MQSHNKSENSTYHYLNIDAVRQREESLNESRYGISVIAGRPLSAPFVNTISKIQSHLTVISPSGLIQSEPANIHLTVLRGQSLEIPIDIPTIVPKMLTSILHGRTVTLNWTHIQLDVDGAIRAYTLPTTWPFSSNKLAEKAIEHLSSYYGVRITVQRRLWATICTLRESACTPDIIVAIDHILSSYKIPNIVIDKLYLLYFQDLQLINADILETYELR